MASHGLSWRISSARRRPPVRWSPVRLLAPWERKIQHRGRWLHRWRRRLAPARCCSSSTTSSTCLSAAPLISELLAACPDLGVLATSRERLHIRGEREFAVRPLAVPARDVAAGEDATGLSGIAAVRLFVERAAEVRADFALTPADTPAVSSAVSSTRWVTTGHRVGGALGQGSLSGGAGRAAGFLAAHAGWRSRRSSGSPADDARHHRLELRAAPARGTSTVSAARCLCRRIHLGGGPGSRRATVAGRRAAGSVRHWLRVSSGCGPCRKTS